LADISIVEQTRWAISIVVPAASDPDEMHGVCAEHGVALDTAIHRVAAERRRDETVWM
jgi:hypothetical protein